MLIVAYFFCANIHELGAAPTMLTPTDRRDYQKYGNKYARSNLRLFVCLDFKFLSSNLR